MKIIAHLETGYVNCEHTEVIDVPDDEIGSMSKAERDEYIYNVYVEPWIWNYIEPWFEEIGEE